MRCTTDVLLCRGEWERCWRRNRLIKDIRPRYNDRLTDGSRTRTLW